MVGVIKPTECDGRMASQGACTVLSQHAQRGCMHASACPAQRPLLREELELRLLLEPRLLLLLLLLLPPPLPAIAPRSGAELATLSGLL
jgi:hypothetical protein